MEENMCLNQLEIIIEMLINSLDANQIQLFDEYIEIDSQESIK